MSRSSSSRDIFVQNHQVSTGQEGRIFFRGSLHEDLHGHQRIAQFVGDPCSHLANCRQLLGPQGLTSASFQSFEDNANLMRDLVQYDFDLFDPGLG